MSLIYSRTRSFNHSLLRDVQKTRSKRPTKKAIICFAVAVLLFMLVSTHNLSGIGMVSTVEASNTLAYDGNISLDTNTADRDARILALSLNGEGPESTAYRDQLMTAYYQGLGRDVMILFNPGGWGSRKLQDSVGWSSIVNGMQKELSQAGYSVVTLNYQRTQNSLPGQLNELKELFSGYPDKSNRLVQMADFLTDHLPRITVILAAESTGTVICDSAMQMLKDNNRVYSIQTGSPFWHQENPGERTLLINNNGVTPDSFSQGDLSTIIGTSLESLIELKKAGAGGEILGFLSAPGHEYCWQEPGVSPRVEKFLSQYYQNMAGVQNLSN
jgi:hypothetical protein